MIERPFETRVPFLRVAAAGLLAGLVLAALLLGVGSLHRARAAVAFWSVCPAGCDYATIQGAVDAASDGDVIRVVGPNTYAENVVITKSLTLDGGCANAACTVQAPGVFRTTIDGGGAGRVVTVRGEPGSPIAVTLDGFTIAGGDATGETERKGGGVGSWDATLILTRDVITDNVAARSSSGRGGGVCVYSGTVSIANTQVVSNQAAASASGRGGGVYLENVDGSLEDSLLQGNLASANSLGYGGGLGAENCGVITLTGSVIYSNTASLADVGEGGGLRFLYGDVVMDGNTLADNLASRDGNGYGGGLRVWNGGAALSHNWFLSNTASVGDRGDGGGFSFAAVTATMDGDSLLGNVATFSSTASRNGDGGRHLGGVLVAANLVVVKNGFPGGGQGEGLDMLGSTEALSLTLVNSTIVSNTDAGVRCAGSLMTGTLVNLIAWGNGDDLACAFTDLAYSDVEDTGDTGPGVIHQDPLFVDAANDDYHLQAGSPCIDAGATPITYTFVPDHDWDDDRRPIGGGYDMGGDEVLLAVYLPLVLRDY